MLGRRQGGVRSPERVASGRACAAAVTSKRAPTRVRVACGCAHTLHLHDAGTTAPLLLAPLTVNLRDVQLYELQLLR